MAELDGPRWGPQAGGKPEQLIVLCHGVGSDGHDLIDLAPTWAKALPHAAFVSPDGPEPYDGAPFGRQWFSLSDRTPSIMLAGIARAALSLDPFIDAELSRLHLPSDAYALMGFSQGAMTALYTGLRRTTPPRAVLAFSGALLGGAATAEIKDRPPVLLVHGDADDVVPASRSIDAERALRTAGVPVELLLCPRLGHGIDEAGLSTGALFLQRAFATSSTG